MPRYFIDDQNQIWSVDDEGQSRYPAHIFVTQDRVEVLGEREKDGFVIDQVFVLHASLTDLALAIEHTPTPSEDGSVSLDVAVAENLHRVMAFRSFWLTGHEKTPDHFPLVFDEDNAGSWNEQIQDFSLSDQD